MRQSVLSLAVVSLLPFAIAESAVAAPVKACDLFSQQTASDIFGAAVAPGAEDAPGKSTSECRFGGPQPNQSVYAGVMDASVLGPNPAAMFKRSIYKGPGSTAEPVHGMGQMAFYVSTPNEKSVNVLYHGMVVAVGAVGSKNPDIKPAILAAAKRFMSKM